jgi:hypothetical protein
MNKRGKRSWSEVVQGKEERGDIKKNDLTSSETNKPIDGRKKTRGKFC